MAVIITLIVVILFIVLLRWMWHSLGGIQKSTKCACMVGGLVVVYIITFVIFNISKIGITYENKEAMKLIQTIFVLLFTIINGYVILPYVFKKLEQVNNEEIDREKLNRSIIILLIIILIVGIFEISYLGNIQQGILNMIKR